MSPYHAISTVIPEFIPSLLNETWLVIAWRACWQSAVLFVLFCSIVAVLRERLAPRWRLMLWSLVLLRLVIVTTPESPISAFNVFSSEAMAASVRTAVPAVALQGIRREIASGALNASPRHSGSSSEGTAFAESNATGRSHHGGEGADVSESHQAIVETLATHRTDGIVSVGSWMAIIWACGLMVFTGRLFSTWNTVRRISRTCRPVTKSFLLECFSRAGCRMGIGRQPSLWVSPRPDSAFVMGILQPRIVVPEFLIDRLSEQEMEFVFAHELAHVKRYDVLIQWFSLLVGVVYWFHPVSWLTNRQMRLTREAACDDHVLSRIGWDHAEQYARTLIRLASQLQPAVAAPGLIGLFGACGNVSYRVRRLSGGVRPGGFASFVAGGLILSCMCLGLTDAVSDEQRPVAADDSQRGESNAPASPSTDRGTVSRTESSDTRPAADFAFKGQCVSHPDNAPLDGAVVRLFAIRGLLREGEEIAATRTDNAGTFRFSGLPHPSELHTGHLQYVVVVASEGRPTQEYPVSFFGKGREITVPCPAEYDSLKGRVVDESGKPVQGALVRTMYWAPPKADGTPYYETKEDGLFLLTGLPATNDEQRVGAATLYISHPDFPPVTVFDNKVPGVVRAVMKRGCTVTGTVVGEDARPVSGVIVSAVPEFRSERAVTRRCVSDSDGRIRICLEEGVYTFILDDDSLVAEALTGIECRKSKSVDLQPLAAQEGAWLVGQIVDTKTEQSVAEVDVGDGLKQRVALGVFGPARPIGQDRLTEVDEHGRFRIRVMPGDNYPFTLNERTSRMMWDTKQMPPVVVEKGTEAFVQIDKTPSETPFEQMAKAMEILESLPKETDLRVEAIIGEFRKLNHTVKECEIWCLLMKELVMIGKPAVMPLCREFEATNEQRMMRRLAFALRALGDPRAVPSLIRVLPKTLQPPSSDYGLIVNDAGLAEFMRQHSIRGDGSGQYFDFGRPVRETVASLNKLTGRTFEGSELASFSRRRDLRSLDRQEKFYYDQAHEWADWWEANWQSFGNDPTFSTVNLPAYAARDLADYPTGLELTENAATDSGSSGNVLTPVGDADHGATFFMDLDSGKGQRWPKELPADDVTPATVEAATGWAANHGADLMCVAQQNTDGGIQYVLVGVGLQLWQMDSLDAANIEQRLKKGKLPEGRKLEQSALLHFDIKSGKNIAQKNSSFLYLTGEQGLGVITITDFVTEARDITGMADTPEGVGYHRGVRFDVTAIAR